MKKLVTITCLTALALSFACTAMAHNVTFQNSTPLSVEIFGTVKVIDDTPRSQSGHRGVSQIYTKDFDVFAIAPALSNQTTIYIPEMAEAGKVAAFVTNAPAKMTSFTLQPGDSTFMITLNDRNGISVIPVG